MKSHLMVAILAVVNLSLLDAEQIISSPLVGDWAVDIKSMYEEDALLWVDSGKVKITADQIITTGGSIHYTLDNKDITGRRIVFDKVPFKYASLEDLGYRYTIGTKWDDRFFIETFINIDKFIAMFPSDKQAAKRKWVKEHGVIHPDDPTNMVVAIIRFRRTTAPVRNSTPRVSRIKANMVKNIAA